MSVLVRRLAPADAALYRALRLEALRRAPEAFGSDYDEEAAQPADLFARRLVENAVFGALDGDALVGIAGFSAVAGGKSRHIGHLFGLYVSPPMRGKGLGEALVSAVVAHARGKVLQLHLGVGTENHPAFRVYERLGFIIFGTEPRSLAIGGRFIDEHLMVRYLDREDI